METTQTASHPSFETVWAALQETDRMMRENAERHDREMKKFERTMKERAKQRERERKEFEQARKKSEEDFNKRLGEYINFFGEVSEYTIAPMLCEKFIELGFTFPRANRNVSVRDKVNNLFFEIDVMLENGDIAVLVEIKTKLTVERINDHIDRLEKMRKYADLRGDSGLKSGVLKSERIFLGAVAGVVVTDKERKYALEQGFYLIEPAGQSLNITPPNGKPKEW